MSTKPESKLPPGLPLWLGLVFFIIGLFIFPMALHTILKERLNGSWPTTSGRVTQSSVTEGWNERQGGTRYEPQVAYEYQVDGKTYKTGRISARRIPGYQVSEDAEEVAAKYRVGASPAVHYDPRDPAIAVLESGVGGEDPVVLGIGGCCLVFGGIPAIIGWRRIRRQRRIVADKGPLGERIMQVLFPLAREVPRDQRRAALPLPQSVPAHSGRPLPEDLEFFHAPPPEIGELLTAHSTLKRHTHPWTTAGRIKLMAVVFVVLAALFWLGIRIADKHYELSLVFTICAVLFAFMSPFALLLTKFQHLVTYVGRAGIARYTLQKSRDGFMFGEVMPFADATDLRAQHVRHYRNGIYQNSSVGFNWSGPDSRKLFYIGGGYTESKGGISGADEPNAHFGVAAELAWSETLLDRMADEFARQGYLHFNIGQDQWVRVGAGYLDLKFSPEVVRLNADEVKTLSIEKGKFHIIHRDAGWWSRQGKFSFEYGKMANAKMFLLAVEKLAGLRFS